VKTVRLDVKKENVLLTTYRAVIELPKLTSLWPTRRRTISTKTVKRTINPKITTMLYSGITDVGVVDGLAVSDEEVLGVGDGVGCGAE